MDYKAIGSKKTENEYEQLGRPELIALVQDLNAQISSQSSEKVTGAAVSRLLARLSLAAAVFLIPFRYRMVVFARPISPIYKDYTDILLFASDVAVIGVITFWMLSLLLEPGKLTSKLTVKPIFLTIPLVGVVLFSAISAIFSIDPVLSLYHTIRLCALFLLYLYAIQDTNTLRWVFLPAGLSILIQATVSLAQILSQSSVGLAWLGELELNPDWSGVSIVWAEGIRSLRAYGLSDHPNILGGCLTSALLVCMLWYITDKNHKSDHWALPVIAGVIFAGGAALFFTYSRSAWLALLSGITLVTLLVVFLNLKNAWLSILGLSLGALVISLPFLWHNAPYLGVRLNYQGSFAEVGNETRAINERRLLNTSANDIFTRHAITGVGIGAY
ncbi:MAG: O-antigen ligase family protein, partial [Anaerolineales bacterium]